MNLSEYIKRRNGVPLGHPDALRNNLQKSLGAKNFSTFWNFWNPIFGYYLGTKIFKPLKRIFPPAFSLVVTFVFCGFIHDMVIALVRQKITLFFSVWFLLMAISVVISKQINYDFSNQTWFLRAFANLSIIGICFILTKYFNAISNFY